MRTMLTLMLLLFAIGKVEAQTDKMVYESLFIQTDRDVYSLGDTIHLSGYLFDLQKGKLADYSRAIYVELVDSEGIVKSRVKVGQDTLQGNFPGYIILNRALPIGNYKLRGFTYWMLNQSPNSYFTKDVVISEQKERYNANGNVQVAISASELGNFNFANVTVSVVEKSAIVSSDNNIVNFIAENSKNGGAVQTDNASPMYYMERGTVLCGVVVNRKGKIEPNAKIAFIGEDNRAYYANSDKNGYVECSVEWDNLTRFYARSEGDFGFHDVLLKQDNPALACDLYDSPTNNPYAWTDKEAVLDVYEYPMSGAASSVRMPMGSADALGSAGDAGYRRERNVAAVYKSYEASSENAPTNVVVKKKRKFNIQRVADGVQRANADFVYNGGATHYWNTNVVINKGEVYEFSYPDNGKECVVIVNGVDNEGRPIWRMF